MPGIVIFLRFLVALCAVRQTGENSQELGGVRLCHRRGKSKVRVKSSCSSSEGIMAMSLKSYQTQSMAASLILLTLKGVSACLAV